jgi:hypothetical protein
VLNDLRAPESCAQTIALQIFVRADSDYELQVPKTSQYGLMPYIPQGDPIEHMLHGENTGVSLGTDSIGGIKLDTNDGTFHSVRCTGEKLRSIKQLLLRNQPLMISNANLSSAPALGAASNTLYPYFFSSLNINASTGVLQSSDFCGDLLSFLAPMYCFYRGSLNISMFNDCSSAGNTHRMRTAITPGAVSTGSTGGPIFTPTIGNMATPTVSPLPGQLFWPAEPVNTFTNGDYLFYQHVPYYARLPFSLTILNNGADFAYTDASLPCTALSWYTTTAVSNGASLQRAVGDDFQLMYFIGCPPVVTGYA